jgi:subtilase family serine protease
MSLHLPTVAALVATGLILSSSPSFAENQHPHSILVAKAEKSVDATAVFSCETRFFDRTLNGGRVACYGPSAIRAAYGLAGLIDAGFNGAGRTIVILDAFGSPTVLEDLKAFDGAFGLPNPPSLTVVTMPGTPTFDPTDGNQVGWAEEVSLDVQWAHAIAPGANIVLVAAASNSDDDLLAGLNYAIDNRLGDVISMSFGESEAFLTDAEGQRVVAKWEKAFKRAREGHITLFVSSGDQGSTNTADDAGNVFPFQNVSYPASSPQVTGVGGTNLFFGKDSHADPNGTYLGETVWNDEPQGIAAAGGGGVSALFSRPPYQDGLPRSVRRSLYRHRGVPDVAYNGGVVGGVIVHLGFQGVPNGFYIFGGTSAGAPQWAGVVADINQALGRPMGFINNRLYRLGQTDRREREGEEHERGDRAILFHDITVGDDHFCFFTTPDGEFACVPGFSATPGWDLATGWGTPNFGALVTLFNRWDDDDDHNDE